MNRLSPAETRQKEGAYAHDSGPNRWEYSLAAGWRRPVSALPAVSRECRVSVNRGEVWFVPQLSLVLKRQEENAWLATHRDKSSGSLSGLGGTLNLLFALTRDKFGRDPDCVMATAAGIYGKVKYCPPILPPCQSDWLPDDRGNRTLVFIW